MIKNERQYRITKAKIGEFEQALTRSFERGAVNSDLHALEKAATQSQIATMRDEVAEYESLLSGEKSTLEVESFDELPRALIIARIASGLSQKALAEKLGLKEQQVQRYEATDYASASLSTIRRIVDALQLSVCKDILLPNADLTLKSLWRRLKDAGLPQDLVLKRLLPSTLRALIEDSTSQDTNDGLAVRVASTIARIFSMAPTVFFGSKPLSLAGAAGSLARFKVSASADATKLAAYAVYAHYLALTALPVAPAPIASMPETASEFRKAVCDAYGSLTFENALQFAWDCGIIVLPLDDSGAFHGACWRINGRHVIVLKQKNHSLARWFFDLLHELRHTVQESDDPDFSVIEAAETSEERRESKFEKDADAFAANVLLNGRAKELAEKCVTLAGGAVERLKSVVPRVAQEAGVEAGALANYMAFRLTRQLTADWWGTAANLQPKDAPDPWKVARDVFVARSNIQLINADDRNLLIRALSDEVE